MKAEAGINFHEEITENIFREDPRSQPSRSISTHAAADGSRLAAHASDVVHTLEAELEDQQRPPTPDPTTSRATVSSSTSRSEEDGDGTTWVDTEAERGHMLHRQMEHVLRTLKNVPEHATPFLRPVTAKMAPDYLEVIAEPMDLGTMGRKLSHGAYGTDMHAFARDLNLIFANCRAYNDEPDNPSASHLPSHL